MELNLWTIEATGKPVTRLQHEGWTNQEILTAAACKKVMAEVTRRSEEQKWNALGN